MNRAKYINLTTTLMKQTEKLNAKRLRYGTSSLENEVEDLDDEDFMQGLRFVIDEVPLSVIDEIFSNKITLEKDRFTRQYKTLIKRAVLGIQEGLNGYILYHVLRSYADLSSKEMKALDRIILLDDDDYEGSDSEEKDTASTVAAYQFSAKRYWAMAIEDIEAELGEGPTGVDFGTVANPNITIKDNCQNIDKVTQIIGEHGGTPVESLDLD
jgi:hypothetical protein